MSVDPPRPKGPPLNAIRAFEAAGRHQSFVGAAQELSVSAGAISQHIKALEGWSGVALFQRNAQGVALTAAGRQLAPRFTAAFDALADATHALRNLSVHKDIHIAALPSVAQLWLSPRLRKVRAAFPDMKFSVTAMENPPNMTRELFDLWLFIGVPGDHPYEVIIAADDVVPVCAPSLVEQIATPEDLNTVPLLHDQTWRDDWVAWSKATGVPLNNATTGPSYSLYSLAVEEAKSGAGALMGHRTLIRDALDDGTLVAAYPEPVTMGRSLILGLPRASRRRAEIDEITAVLLDELQ